MNLKSAVLTGLATMTLAASSQATIWNLWGNLSGLNEVPPNASPGSGSFSGTLNDVTGAILLNGSYSGMLGPVIASHIHGPAPVGVNAPVIVLINNTGGTSGTLSLNTILSAPNVAHVLAGNTYVNVHTNVFPGGEIRDQIHVEPVPEPATLAALGLGAAALAKRRRR